MSQHQHWRLRRYTYPTTRFGGRHTLEDDDEEAPA